MQKFYFVIVTGFLVSCGTEQMNIDPSSFQLEEVAIHVKEIKNECKASFDLDRLSKRDACVNKSNVFQDDQMRILCEHEYERLGEVHDSFLKIEIEELSTKRDQCIFDALQIMNLDKAYIFCDRTFSEALDRFITRSCTYDQLILQNPIFEWRINT